MLINFSILSRNNSSVDIKHSLASISKNATPTKCGHNIRHHHTNQNFFVNSVKSIKIALSVTVVSVQARNP